MAKLWLDDVRKPPDDSWTWCKSVDEAIEFVYRHDCEEWALDHDLGGQLAHYGKGPYDAQAKTGWSFIVDCVNRKVLLPNRVTIHSTNTEGVGNMVRGLHFWAKSQERDIEIIVRPMAGSIMDKTPYYEPALRA